jgi:hypothetical protein
MNQPTVTIYVDYKGTPHTFIRLNDANGNSEYFGFAPETPGSAIGAGKIGRGITTHAQGDPDNSRAGYMDDVAWSKEIPITHAQLEAMRSAVNTWDDARHTYNVTGVIAGENCTTFAKAMLAAGGLTYPGLSSGVNPLSLIPNSEQAPLFDTGPDGRKSLSDAVRDPLNTPGTPAYEYKQAHPEMFAPRPDAPSTPDESTSELYQNSDGSYTEEILQTGEFAGDTTRIEYVASGEVSEVTEVDGAGDNTDYDMRTTTYDAEGRLDSATTAMDDGTHIVIDYDQAGEHPYSHIESSTDIDGRTDYWHVFTDDGASTWFDFDQDNTRADSLYKTEVDALGRTDWVSITADDGTSTWLDYDQNNSRADSLYQSHADALGRTDWVDITADDGAHIVTDYDQNGLADWIHIISHIDSLGRTADMDIYRDDGSRDLWDYDQNGTETWSRVETTFDAAGNKDYRVLYEDGGARAEYEYFPEVHPDAYALSYFYADGHGAGGRVTFDGYAHSMELVGGNNPEWPDSTVDFNFGYALEPYY